VTLFAAGDSVTVAELVPGVPRSLRLDSTVIDPVAHHLAQLRHVLARAGRFDVIHNHMDYIGFPLGLLTDVPVVTTLHGRLDMPDLVPLFAAYPESRVISISDAQRTPLPNAGWIATVHHGLPSDLFRAGTGEGGYLAFLGRVSPEKRLDSAIRVAEAARTPLKIAAKIDKVDVGYFESVIRPMLSSPFVEFIGEIGEDAKQRFLGDARALLFPVDWPEPFGLVMIEAFACGTPVVTRRRGSVPEVIDDGVTGFICDDERQMIEAVGRLNELDRATCRSVFDRRFTAERMARDYLRVYAALPSELRGAA
jgi:glycosyltransferase involved in cell wall biosynthesis